MINGKFYTGLPPKMIERSNGLDRQQTHFFWPDDTQNKSAVESRVQRRTSIQAENRDAYIPMADHSNSDAENKERFKKEFTKSSIQFYDNDEQTPLRRNRQRLTEPPTRKIQNVEPPVNTFGKRKESFASKIEFYDFADDLNNVPRTDKNNKAEVERNTKNSPKLQNKHLTFDPPDEAINFIENNVRNMRIITPPRRRNTSRDNRPRYGKPASTEGQHYSDFSEDYISPRGLPLQAPIRNRYAESDPDFDDYAPRRLPMNPRPAVYYENDSVDYIDTQPVRSVRHHHYDDGSVSTRKTGRQVHFTYSGNGHNSVAAALSQDYTLSQPPQHLTRKVNVLKADNATRNSEQRTIPITIAGTASSPPTSPPAAGVPSHLMSNICFSDNESTTTTPSCPTRRNIRNSAVGRVSVGLPD